MELLIIILLGLIFIALLVYGIIGKEFKVIIRHETAREMIKAVPLKDLSPEEQMEIREASIKAHKAEQTYEEQKDVISAVQEIVTGISEDSYVKRKDKS